MLSSKYQQEQIGNWKNRQQSLSEEIRKMEQEMIGAEKWVELIKEKCST